MPLPIEDYGLIGDCLGSALVGRDGSIDWLCLPRFDSAAAFAAILGTPEHGRWLVAPAEPVRSVARRYRRGTLMLETEFTTDSGTVTVIDFMPPRDRAPNVVRIVAGQRGAVPMRMQLIVRFDYGSVIPWVRRTDDGIQAIGGPEALRLHSSVPVHGEEFTTAADFTVEAGKRESFVLAWHASHEEAPPAISADEAESETQAWWEEWSNRCTYEGPWRDAVLQSLVTLKALTYAPTGGMVAAPTTSLPTQIGGSRNWDYRFCWLRDATFTLYALVGNGYTEEACAWRDWLLRAVAGDPAQINIMYGLGGERRLSEMELDWLPGYENSKPVRIGNAAFSQLQLDVYGEVMDLLHMARRHGLSPDENGWRVQGALLRYLETGWREPDEGIWEMRGPRRHFTHSKVMAWVAFDRAIKDAEECGLDGPIDTWRSIRAQIHQEVCAKGFDADANTFVQFYGSKDVDASLLMIPLVGFLPPEDERVRGTVAAVQERLTENGFVYRYPNRPAVDGLPPGEATFLICTFWLADCLKLTGREEEARELFERLLALRNDLGLLPEQYDPKAKRLLGNFPQAFSHLGIINTAVNLSRRTGPAAERKES